MATFVVKSNLNITVSIIKNAPDDMKFVRVWMKMKTTGLP